MTNKKIAQFPKRMGVTDFVDERLTSCARFLQNVKNGICQLPKRQFIITGRFYNLFIYLFYKMYENLWIELQRPGGGGTNRKIPSKRRERGTNRRTPS